MLLNSKTIIECNDIEEENHIWEIQNIVSIIQKLPNYECLVLINKLDKLHSQDNQEIMSCLLHDFMELPQYFDIKNGVDFEIGDSNIFNVICYGGTYIVEGQSHFIKTCISILPYDSNKEFIDISNYLILQLKQTNRVVIN